MYSICYMSLQDHLIEESCTFLGGSSSCYVTTLASLVTISIVLHDLTRSPHWRVMQIFGWELLVLFHHHDKFGDHKHCVTWPCNTISLRSHANFWVKPLVVYHQPDKFDDHKHCVTWPYQTTSLWSHANFWVGAPCGMSPPWQVWWP